MSNSQTSKTAVVHPTSAVHSTSPTPSPVDNRSTAPAYKYEAFELRLSTTSYGHSSSEAEIVYWALKEYKSNILKLLRVNQPDDVEYEELTHQFKLAEQVQDHIVTHLSCAVSSYEWVASGYKPEGPTPSWLAEEEESYEDESDDDPDED